MSSRILLMMTVMLVITYTLKLCGAKGMFLKYNDKMIEINDFCDRYYLKYLFSYVSLAINNYLICGIIFRNKNDLAIKGGLIIGFVAVIYRIIFIDIILVNPSVIFILDIVNIALVIMIISKKQIKLKTLIADYLFALSIQLIAQFLSLNGKGLNMPTIQDNLIMSLILSFDFYLWYGLIYIIIYFGGNTLCGDQCLFSALLRSCGQLWVSFSESLTELWLTLSEKRKNSTKKDKIGKNVEVQELSKLAITFYVLLVILYNAFTVLIILLLASVYNVVASTVIALICFTINKKFFGKELHFKSSLICLMVSIGSYYMVIRMLNPISAGTNLSVLLGSLLGLITSYIASEKMGKNVIRSGPITTKEALILKYQDYTKDELIAIANNRGLRDCVGETVYHYIRMSAEKAAEIMQVQPRTIQRRVADFNKKEDTSL